MVEYFIKPKLKDFSGSLLTTVNTYATIPDSATSTNYFYVRGYRYKSLVLSATTNNLLYSLDGSNDASTWFNIKTDQALNVGTPVLETDTDLYNYYRVQIKPATADQHGTGTAKLVGSTL